MGETPELQIDGFSQEKFETEINPYLCDAVSKMEDGDMEQFKSDQKFSTMVRNALFKAKGDIEIIDKILESLFKLMQFFVIQQCSEGSFFNSVLYHKYLKRWIDMLSMVIHKLLYEMYADCGPYYIDENGYREQFKKLNCVLSSYNPDSDINEISPEAVAMFILAVARGTGSIDEVLLFIRNNAKVYPKSEDHPEGNPENLINILADLIHRLASMYQPNTSIIRNPKIGGIVSSIRSRTVH